RAAPLRQQPHTFQRGNDALSTRSTATPARASWRATRAPAGPAPTTTASQRRPDVSSRVRLALHLTITSVPLAGSHRRRTRKRKSPRPPPHDATIAESGTASASRRRRRSVPPPRQAAGPLLGYTLPPPSAARRNGPPRSATRAASPATPADSPSGCAPG